MATFWHRKGYEGRGRVPGHLFNNCVVPDSLIGVILLFGELTKPHRYGDRACHGTVPRAAVAPIVSIPGARGEYQPPVSRQFSQVMPTPRSAMRGGRPVLLARH